MSSFSDLLRKVCFGAAGSMLRERDPLAPSSLTDEQKRAICPDLRISELRQEQRELKKEM
jgi:hypothetical protein